MSLFQQDMVKFSLVIICLPSKTSHNETKNNRDEKHIILTLKTKFTANLMQQNGIVPGRRRQPSDLPGSLKNAIDRLEKRY